MTGFVLRREDGKFVARPGFQESYTADILKARVFPSHFSAESDRCIENEQVVSLSDLFQVRS
jgi:hypothetical protein